MILTKAGIMLGLVLPFFQMPNLPKRDERDAGGGGSIPNRQLGTLAWLHFFAALFFYLLLLLLLLSLLKSELSSLLLLLLLLLPQLVS